MLVLLQPALSVPPLQPDSAADSQAAGEVSFEILGSFFMDFGARLAELEDSASAVSTVPYVDVVAFSIAHESVSCSHLCHHTHHCLT